MLRILCLMFIPVVSEFLKDFLTDLPGLSPYCQIDFCIDLEANSQPH